MADLAGLYAVLQHCCSSGHSERNYMINEIQSLLDEYTCWLKEKIQVRQVDGWVEITTPYLDRHNDYLQIYAQHRNRPFYLQRNLIIG
ncbi:MAG: hypothetical protein U9N40_05230 [Euryarchaeota archaeon]|nr:hypothetical protein [Euryarchaeota archaeon]